MPASLPPPGERVAIRWASPDGPREAVGTLLAVEDATLTLRPEGGPPRTVPRAALAAVRVVPPRPVRPASPIEDVELLAARGWPGTEQHRLGGWLLRAGGPPAAEAADPGSRRANSCLPTGDAGIPIEAAIEQVVAWYAERGRTPTIQLPEASAARGARFRRAPDDVAAALAAAGWVRSAPTLVLVGDVRRMPPRAAPYPARVAWADEPDADWWALDGSSPARRAEALAAPARYLTVRGADGGPLACGRLALVQDWAGVSNLTVAPDARRRGHGRRALEAMLAHATERGARFAYLQVATVNTAAIALYEGHGFTRHHGYAYHTPAEG